MLSIYADHETALSAVRNLKDVHISGRSLRVELSTDEPGPKKAGAPGAAGGGPVVPPGPPGRLPGGPGGFAGAPAPGLGQGQFGAPPGPPGGGFGFGRGGPGGAPGLPPPTLPPSGPGPGPGTAAPGVNMNMLPPGQDLPMGERATDVISKTLASIPPGKLEEVLMGMKVSLLVTSFDTGRIEGMLIGICGRSCADNGQGEPGRCKGCIFAASSIGVCVVPGDVVDERCRSQCTAGKSTNHRDKSWYCEV